MQGWPKGVEPIVVMGPTADNAKAQTYDVRTPIQDAAAIENALKAAFNETQITAAIHVDATPEWQGISRLRASTAR